MNKKTPVIVLLLLLLAAFNLRAQSGNAAPPPAPSGEMSAIVESLQAKGGRDLDVSTLPKMSKEDAAKFDSNGMEVYSLPPPPGTADMFFYTVYYDKKQAKYWVRRTGGFAGLQELYGPVATKVATSL